MKTIEEINAEIEIIENTVEDVVIRDSLILEKLFSELPISGCKTDEFFCDTGNYKLIVSTFWARRRKFLAEVASMAGQDAYDGQECRGYTGSDDVGHTAPDYKNIFSLGLSGILARLQKHAEGAKTPREQRYYEAGIRVWRAAIAYLERAAEEACTEAQAKALRAIVKRPPETLFEAMQLTVAYYVIQHRFDGSHVRTLGRLDEIYMPYYEADLAAGRIDEKGARELVAKFLKQINSWDIQANIPFALGGVGADKKSAVNAMSYILMEEYSKLALPCVKLHLLYTDDMPKSLVKTALDSVRKGANSICFMGDKVIRESLLTLGEDEDDAREYAVVGCYECGGRGEITCSCNAKVNIPKAIELVFNDGVDMGLGKRLGRPVARIPESFEEFYSEFLAQLDCLCQSAIDLTDAFEKLYYRTHSAPILSATYDACVESGRDIYCDYGAKYTNSSLNAFGMATAVDSLYAVKKLVYEDGLLSFSQLGDILKNNWEGNEALRLKVLKKLPKYGTNFEEIDLMARDIVNWLSDKINKRPNAKGGIYRLGTFSINWRWEFGEKLAATPDGRKRGEPFSQNSGASFGADSKGVTAHIVSATRQDFTLTPNGSTLDLDLHSSAVKGEEGLDVMYATLVTFMERGGFAVHYNVLDSGVLKKAMEKPEDHPNLQVRLCGWNVLFSNLSKDEQEEFIKRSEAIV